MVIRLEPYKKAHWHILKDLQLAPEQAEFTALPSQLLPMLEGNPERLGVTILENEVPVGLFALSVGEHRDKYLPQPDPAGVALGALSLDRRCQGRGVGSAAMRQLSDFVPRHFPSAQHVLLVVNQRNPAAKTKKSVLWCCVSGRGCGGRSGSCSLTRYRLPPQAEGCP